MIIKTNHDYNYETLIKHAATFEIIEVMQLINAKPTGLFLFNFHDHAGNVRLRSMQYLSAISL